MRAPVGLFGLVNAMSFVSGVTIDRRRSRLGRKPSPASRFSGDIGLDAARNRVVLLIGWDDRYNVVAALYQPFVHEHIGRYRAVVMVMSEIDVLA